MLEDIQTAVPLGFLLSFVIGPVFFVLLETSATKGFRAGVSFDIGVVMADIIFLLIAYFSSFQLLENLSNQPGLFVFGGMILLVYGIVVFVKKESKTTTSLKLKKGTYLGLLAKGFFLNFLNIGVLAFWLGLVVVVGPSLDNDPNRMLIFFGTVMLVYFFTDVIKIILAKQLKKYLTKERVVLIKKALGVVLIVCGIVLISRGFLPKEKFNIQEGIERIGK